jgi:hypothetical protein
MKFYLKLQSSKDFFHYFNFEWLPFPNGLSYLDEILRQKWFNMRL